MQYRSFVLVLTLAAILPARALAQSAPPADLQAVLAASGNALGAAAMNAAQGWHYHGTGTAAGLPGTFDGWVDRAVGSEATYAKIVPVSTDGGYDGTQAWTRDDKGVVWVEGSVVGVAQARNQIYRDAGSLWTKDRGGAAVAFVGRRTDGGATFDVVRVTLPNDIVPFEYWFDATTHLPMRVVEVTPPVTTTTTFADYRDVGGFKYPYSQNSLTSQNNGQTLTVDSFVRDPAGLAEQVRKPSSTVHDFSIAGSDKTTVPFDIVDNHVYLNVMLNGKGPYRFIFDTGGQNVVDSAVAREIGATAVGSIQGSGVGETTEQSAFARVASLRVGAAELSDQTFLVLPVRQGFGVSASAAVDGLIGWEVLARFVTTFDYGNKQLTLSTNAGPAPGKTTAFVFGGTQPQMPCAIDSIQTLCSVDTGSRAALDLYTPFLLAHPSVAPANATQPGVNGFGVGGASLGRLGRLGNLDLGGYALPDLVAGFIESTKSAFATEGIGANVGGDVWRRFTVTFDYPHETIALAPNADFGVRDTYDRSGVFAIAQGSTLVVAAVRGGTPAATAGLTKGDVIVSVDGVAAPQLTLGVVRAAFRRPAGTALALRVLSAGAKTPHDVTLILRDYV